MRFVHNLILNNSYEFYYDDVTATSFVNDKYGDATAESIPFFYIIHFLWCVQYMVTSVLQDQQYMFDVRSLLVDEKVLLMEKDLVDVLFQRLIQRSQQSRLSYGLIGVYQ